MATLFDSLSLSGSTSGVVIGNSFFTLSDLAKMTALRANITNTGAAFYATPRKLGEASGYQVPTGKKYIVVAVQLYSNSGAVGESVALQTADTDVGWRSAAQPTGYDDSAVAHTQWDLGLGVVSTSEANRQANFPDRTVIRIIPEGKYLYVSGALTAGEYFVHIFGFEIDANATTI